MIPTSICGIAHAFFFLIFFSTSSYTSSSTLFLPNRASNHTILSPCFGVLELVSLYIFGSFIVRLYFGITK